MICLDTTVLVDLLKPKASRQRSDAEEKVNALSHAGEFLFTTRVNVAEILVGAYRGVDLKAETARINLILRAISILELDEPSADRFARIKAATQSAGRSVGDADLLIASIALANGCGILTRKLKDFQFIQGLKVEGY